MFPLHTFSSAILKHLVHINRFTCLHYQVFLSVCSRSLTITIVPQVRVLRAHQPGRVPAGEAGDAGRLHAARRARALGRQPRRPLRRLHQPQGRREGAYCITC